MLIAAEVSGYEQLVAGNAGSGKWSLAIAGLLAAAELWAAGRRPYGWFIDELYYRACASRLAWGYVDHPPLSIALLAASRSFFGDSLLAMRAWPAVIVAAVALSSSALAGRLGGGTFARALAALCVVSTPAGLILGSFFSMNALELLAWSGCALVFVDVVDRGGARWIMLGGLLGFSVLNKHTSAAFALALVVGSLITPARAHYRTRWPWLGAVLAVVIVAPNVAWQLTHGSPSLEFYEQAQRIKNIPTPPWLVLAGQARVAGLVGAPLALFGLGALLRGRGVAAARGLGVAFLVLLALLMLAQSSRADRLAAYHPILFAAGATALEAATKVRFRWLRHAAVLLALAGVVALLPVMLPGLPPPRVAAYSAALGIFRHAEKNRSGALPQWLADRLGWTELVSELARVFGGLTPEERARSLIFTPNYGEAGALELWGPSLGLPRVISNHNSYHRWSENLLTAPENAGVLSDPVVITVGVPRGELEVWFAAVEAAGVYRCEYCIDWRQERPILIARGPKRPLRETWGVWKHFE